MSQDNRALAKAHEAAVAASPLALHYQAKWLDEQAQVAFWEKSRRIGASWITACLAVMTSAPAHGQDTLYIGYSEDMTREFIDDCATWSKALQHVAVHVNETLFDDTTEEGDTKQIKAFRIDFASGFKILALSSRPRSIRGKQGLVIIDEAAFHDDLPGLLKAALALLIWGGRVRVLSSHNGADNYFNQVIQDIRGGKLPYALHRTTLDDALADGLYRRVCQKLGQPWTQEGETAWRADLLKRYGDAANEELFCIPRDGSGAWLSRALIDACMKPGVILRWKPPADDFVMWRQELREAEVEDWCERLVLPELKKLDPLRAHVLGGDFGRVADLTCFSVGEILQNLTLRQSFGVELSSMPFEQQKQVLFYILSRLPRFRAAKLDARGIGAHLSEVAMQKFGSRVEGVMATEQWYRENTQPLKTAFEDRSIELVKDADQMDDLRLFEVIKGVARMPDRKIVGTDGKKRHGDSGIAILMMHAASLAKDSPIEYQGIPGRRSAESDDDFDDNSRRAA